MNGVIDKKSNIYIFGKDDITYNISDAFIENGYKCYVKDANEVTNITFNDDDYVFIFAKNVEEEFKIKKELLRKYKKYIVCISVGEKLENVNKMLRVSGFCNKEIAMIHNPFDGKNPDTNISDMFMVLLDDMKNYVPKPLDKNLKG